MLLLLVPLVVADDGLMMSMVTAAVGMMTVMMMTMAKMMTVEIMTAATVATTTIVDPQKPATADRPIVATDPLLPPTHCCQQAIDIAIANAIARTIDGFGFGAHSCRASTS
jgi:hypothetical protein